jgi:hypothetical protein
MRKKEEEYTMKDLPLTIQFQYRMMCDQADTLSRETLLEEYKNMIALCLKQHEYYKTTVAAMLKFIPQDPNMVGEVFYD